MINVLVTAIGGDIAQGVIKSLSKSPFKVNVVGTDVNEYAAGLFLVDFGYIVPRARDPELYLKKLVEICNDHSVDIIFPCNEIEQRLIAENINKLSRLVKGYFVVQPKSVLKISQDKVKTYTFLRDAGILTPITHTGNLKTSEIIKKFGLPFIIKSRFGTGSKYFHIIKSKDDCDKYLPIVPEPVFQEYVSNDNDEEYTVGLFLNNSSRVLGAITMLRRLSLGSTNHAIAGIFPKVSNVAIKTAETIGAIGPCNVQLRMNHKNEPAVIEINARISGTVALRSKLGFNEVTASIDYFVKNIKPTLHPKAGVAMRTWDELIVPVDWFEKLRNKKRISRK